MCNYTGQIIFIGIDVHKKTYSVTAIHEGIVVKKDTFLADPERLISYCHKYFPGAIIYSAYEAGFSGFYLHRKLVSNGINNIVVNAASIEIAARDRVKTDKRDSLKIASQLSVGRLRAIYVPSEAREKMRILTRLREQLVKDKTRLASQIKAHLNYFGILKANDNKKISNQWIESLVQLNLDHDIQFAINMLAERWLKLADEIKIVDLEFGKQAAKDHDLEDIYRSCPGFGKISARILANELGDMSHFSNIEGLYSYTGLTPQEYSSGEHKRQGHISRQGKSILRKILIEAAWRARKKDHSLMEKFTRIEKKSGKKIAIVAVARVLIGRLRACFRDGEKYICEL